MGSESGQSTLEATLSTSQLRRVVGGAGKAWRVRVEKDTRDACEGASLIN